MKHVPTRQFFIHIETFWISWKLYCFVHTSQMWGMCENIINILKYWRRFDSFCKYFTWGFISKNQPKCKHSIYDYMWLVIVCDYIWEYLQLQDQLSSILVIFTTMMQLLEIPSYWLHQFYIYFHPIIDWYVPLVIIITKSVAF